MAFFNKEAEMELVELDKKLTDLKSKNRAEAKENARLVAQLEEVKVERDTYKAAVEHKRKQEAKQIELDNKENLLKAKEKAQETLTEEINKLTAKVEKSKEEGHKEGYADGIADGLRKIHEITAEDRRMMMQVAALAAASHTPGAAEEIAQTTGQMLKSLGDGKDGNSKS